MYSDQDLLTQMGQAARNCRPSDGDSAIQLLPAALSSFPFRYPMIFTAGGIVETAESFMNNGQSVAQVGAGSATTIIANLLPGVYELYMVGEVVVYAGVATGSEGGSLIVTDTAGNQLGSFGFKNCYTLNVPRDLTIGPLIVAFRQPVHIRAAVFSTAGQSTGHSATCLGSRLL